MIDYNTHTHTHTHTHTDRYAQTHMLSVLIARLSSPVSSSFFSCYWSGIFPRLGEARVSQTKWANQRMSTDIECAWNQPWSCIPLLSVSHSTRKRSRSHRISLFTSFLLSTFNYYFISLQRSVSKSHLKFLKSPIFPATSPSYPSPYTCSCVCVPAGFHREWQWLVQ